MILGIDIGGSGVKGAPVDVTSGTLTAERYRIPTPQPADVTGVVSAAREVAARFGVADRVGVTFPGVVVDGVTRTAANVDHSRLAAPPAELFSAAIGRPAGVPHRAPPAGHAQGAFCAGPGGG